MLKLEVAPASATVSSGVKVKERSANGVEQVSRKPTSRTSYCIPLYNFDHVRLYIESVAFDPFCAIFGMPSMSRALQRNEGDAATTATVSAAQRVAEYRSATDRLRAVSKSFQKRKLPALVGLIYRLSAQRAPFNYNKSLLDTFRTLLSRFLRQLANFEGRFQAKLEVGGLQLQLQLVLAKVEAFSIFSTHLQRLFRPLDGYITSMRCSGGSSLPEISGAYLRAALSGDRSSDCGKDRGDPQVLSTQSLAQTMLRYIKTSRSYGLLRAQMSLSPVGDNRTRLMCTEKTLIGRQESTIAEKVFAQTFQLLSRTEGLNIPPPPMAAYNGEQFQVQEYESRDQKPVKASATDGVKRNAVSTNEFHYVWPRSQNTQGQGCRKGMRRFNLHCVKSNLLNLRGWHEKIDDYGWKDVGPSIRHVTSGSTSVNTGQNSMSWYWGRKLSTASVRNEFRVGKHDFIMQPILTQKKNNASKHMRCANGAIGFRTAPRSQMGFRFANGFEIEFCVQVNATNSVNIRRKNREAKGVKESECMMQTEAQRPDNRPFAQLLNRNNDIHQKEVPTKKTDGRSIFSVVLQFEPKSSVANDSINVVEMTNSAVRRWRKPLRFQNNRCLAFLFSVGDGKMLVTASRGRFMTRFSYKDATFWRNRPRHEMFRSFGARTRELKKKDDRQREACYDGDKRKLGEEKTSNPRERIVLEDPERQNKSLKENDTFAEEPIASPPLSSPSPPVKPLWPEDAQGKHDFRFRISYDGSGKVLRVFERNCGDGGHSEREIFACQFDMLNSLDLWERPKTKKGSTNSDSRKRPRFMYGKLVIAGNNGQRFDGSMILTELTVDLSQKEMSHRNCALNNRRRLTTTPSIFSVCFENPMLQATQQHYRAIAAEMKDKFLSSPRGAAHYFAKAKTIIDNEIMFWKKAVGLTGDSHLLYKVDRILRECLLNSTDLLPVIDQIDLPHLLMSSNTRDFNVLQDALQVLLQETSPVEISRKVIRCLGRAILISGVRLLNDHQYDVPADQSLCYSLLNLVGKFRHVVGTHSREIREQLRVSLERSLERVMNHSQETTRSPFFGISHHLQMNASAVSERESHLMKQDRSILTRSGDTRDKAGDDCHIRGNENDGDNDDDDDDDDDDSDDAHNPNKHARALELWERVAICCDKQIRKQVHSSHLKVDTNENLDSWKYSGLPALLFLSSFFAGDAREGFIRLYKQHMASRLLGARDIHLVIPLEREGVSLFREEFGARSTQSLAGMLFDISQRGDYSIPFRDYLLSGGVIATCVKEGVEWESREEKKEGKDDKPRHTHDDHNAAAEGGKLDETEDNLARVYATWECMKCTLVNDNDAQRCIICNYRRPTMVERHQQEIRDRAQLADWACGHCTLINVGGHHCRGCGEKRPELTEEELKRAEKAMSEEKEAQKKGLEMWKKQRKIDAAILIQKYVRRKRAMTQFQKHRWERMASNSEPIVLGSVVSFEPVVLHHTFWGDFQIISPELWKIDYSLQRCTTHFEAYFRKAYREDRRLRWLFTRGDMILLPVVSNGDGPGSIAGSSDKNKDVQTTWMSMARRGVHVSTLQGFILLLLNDLDRGPLRILSLVSLIGMDAQSPFHIRLLYRELRGLVRKQCVSLSTTNPPMISDDKTTKDICSMENISQILVSRDVVGLERYLARGNNLAPPGKRDTEGWGGDKDHHDDDDDDDDEHEGVQESRKKGVSAVDDDMIIRTQWRVVAWRPVSLQVLKSSQGDSYDICALCRFNLLELCIDCASKGPPSPTTPQHHKSIECVITHGICGHSFHRHCLVKYMKMRNNHRRECPLHHVTWKSVTKDNDGDGHSQRKTT